MRPIWHRINTVPSRTQCILCQHGVRPARTSLAATTLTGVRLRRYSAAAAATNTAKMSAEFERPANATARSSDGRKQENYQELLRWLVGKSQTFNNKRRHGSCNGTSPPRPIPAVVSEFYRLLATEDIDLIWPKYNTLYEQQQHRQITKKAYRRLFHAAIRGRATQKNLHRILDLVEDLKERGIELRSIEYDALMHWVGGHCVPNRRAQHLNQALSLYEDMQRRNMKPSLVTFNTLIHIASQVPDLRTAQHLYHDMIAQGIQPDAYTYSTLLRSMGRMGDLSGVERMLDQLQSMPHVRNNTVVWNAVIASYMSNGRSDEADAVFADMCRALQWKRRRRRRWRENGHQAQEEEEQCTETSNNDDDDCSLAEPENNIPPADAYTFRIHIENLLRKNQVKEALCALEQMTAYGLRPETAVYNALFMQIGNQPDAATLRRLYAHMREHSVPPNSDTMYSLVSALLDSGDTKFALETFYKISLETQAAEVAVQQQVVETVSVARLVKKRLKKDKTKKWWPPSKVDPRPELLDRIKALLLSS